MDLYEAANKLLSWDVLKSLGIRDVLIDTDTDTVALVGPALKLELHIVKPQFIRNYDYHLNTSFAQHFGIPIEVEHWERSSTVRGTKPMWFHGNTDERNGEAGEHIEDLLSGLEHALQDVLEIPNENNRPRVVLLNDPGYPFTPGTTKKNYSAKTKKEYSVSLPPYAMQIKNRENETVWAVNFCKFLPVVCADGRDAVAGKFRDGDEFLVTHATMMYKDAIKVRDDTAEILAQCPGMLFPSLATGLIPATNFGETVLVIRPDVILGSMKPYKQKGMWASASYATDVWTNTAGEFVNDIAILTWKQMHSGDVNWYYCSHLYALGPEIKETGFGGEEVKPITSTKQLASNMRRKFSQWKPDITLDKFKVLSEQSSGLRYAYLETKLNIILGWDCIPIAVCPEQVSSKVSANLGKYGFKGKVLAVPLDDEVLKAVTEGTKDHDVNSYLMYRYAWIVREVILNYAREHNQFFDVSEG